MTTIKWMVAIAIVAIILGATISMVCDEYEEWQNDDWR